MRIIITTVAKKTVPVIQTMYIVGMDGKPVGDITLYGVLKTTEVQTTVIDLPDEPRALEASPFAFENGEFSDGDVPFANELTPEELGAPCPHCGGYHGEDELAFELPPVPKTVPPIFKRDPKTGSLNKTGANTGKVIRDLFELPAHMRQPYEPKATVPGANGKQPCPDCGQFHEDELVFALPAPTGKTVFKRTTEKGVQGGGGTQDMLGSNHC